MVKILGQPEPKKISASQSAERVHMKLLNLMPFFEEDGISTGAGDAGADTGADLFDTSDIDSGEESEPESQPEPTETDAKESNPELEKPAPEAIPEKFKVKYNKQEMELTKEQIIEAAEKGMDYERVRSHLDRYKDPIERLAQQAGLSTDQFLGQLGTLIKTNAVESKRLAFMNEGIDEPMAQRLAEMAYENETLKNGQVMREQQESGRAQAAQQVKDRIDHEIAEFGNRFPDVDKIPDEVISKIKSGESPVVAYQDYLIQENQKKIKAIEQTNKNKETSPGPVKSIGSEKSDPFLDGLLGG